VTYVATGIKCFGYPSRSSVSNKSEMPAIECMLSASHFWFQTLVTHCIMTVISDGGADYER